MAKTFTDCPVEYTASLIANKENLRELEKDGIINRKVYPEVPPKVEYSLTKKGEDLKEVIETMKVFGLKYKGKD